MAVHCMLAQRVGGAWAGTRSATMASIRSVTPSPPPQIAQLRLPPLVYLVVALMQVCATVCGPAAASERVMTAASLRGVLRAHALYQAWLVAGTIFGFFNLVPRMTDAGVFRDLCADTDKSCDAQAVRCPLPRGAATTARVRITPLRCNCARVGVGWRLLAAG